MNNKKVGLTVCVIFGLVLVVFTTLGAQSNKVRSMPGIALAGVWGRCASIDDAVGSHLRRSFNNVNNNPISIADGSPKGYCTIDFGFDISDRYILVTATHPDTPLGASVSAPPFLSATSVEIFTWHALADAAVSGADIFVIVY